MECEDFLNFYDKEKYKLGIENFPQKVIYNTIKLISWKP